VLRTSRHLVRRRLLASLGLELRVRLVVVLQLPALTLLKVKHKLRAKLLGRRRQGPRVEVPSTS